MKQMLAFALPKFSLIAFIIKKPVFLVGTVPVILVAKLVVDFESVAWILFGLFLTDFITGILASWMVWRKSDHVDKWFFGKGEGFSSDKAKKMGVKALVYLGVPFLSIRLQQVLFLKNFKYARVSDAEFELATIALILFCLIELFSIFNENLPKCGFDIWQRTKKIIRVYKKVKNEIAE